MQIIRYRTRKSIQTATAVFTLLLSGCVPALAAGGVGCSSSNGLAEISISTSRLPIYAASSASARLADKIWMSNPQNGETELGPSQGFMEPDRFAADFTDAEVNKIIISLRINTSAKETENGYPGTLTFEDGIQRKIYCLFE